MTSIGGRLVIRYNDFLSSLNGLADLTSIGGMLDIVGNTVLTRLAGLDSIDAGSISDLAIQDNTSLSTCEVKSICDYLASPNGTDLFGGNATGCNTQQEVENACAAVGVEWLNPGSSFTIYPNPACTKINIESSVTGSKINGTVCVFGMTGQELIRQQVQGSRVELNVVSLPQGIYFIRLMNSEKTDFGKFVKE